MIGRQRERVEGGQGNYGFVRRLVDDLRECVAEACKADPGDKEGNGAIYGMAEALPDRHIIGDVLVAYQEATLDS